MVFLLKNIDRLQIIQFTLFCRQREAELEKLDEEDETRDVEDVTASPAVTRRSGDAKVVARTFRYMRRKPTIISYKPPEGRKKGTGIR